MRNRRLVACMVVLSLVVACGVTGEEAEVTVSLTEGAEATIGTEAVAESLGESDLVGNAPLEVDLLPGVIWTRAEYVSDNEGTAQVSSVFPFAGGSWHSV